MPLYGNIIMGVAAILASVAGCGLTALMYYSQRKGYDEPARSDRAPREQVVRKHRACSFVPARDLALFVRLFSMTLRERSE